MSNPKKEHGPTRHLGMPNYDVKAGRKVYDNEMKKLSVKPDLSYFNDKNGGFVVWMDGHQHEEEGKENEEYILAKAIADEGYWVYLLPEKNKDGAVTLRLTKKGDKTFVDGKVESLTGIAYYEQWSPTTANKKYGILGGLEHASDKGCELLAIYDPTNILDKELVRKGMREYEKGRSKGRSYIKMKGVITYNAEGKFNSWYWEDL